MSPAAEVAARSAREAGGEALPRLLTIMGSGETSPTMVKTHRRLLALLGPAPVPAVLLDTPFGFQENADDIAARARAYFAESVGAQVEVASFRSGEGADRLDQESFLAQVRAARYVFAGPGSPTYALRQWAGSGLPALLADKLARGGAVTFASAAALTLGVATVPVYEVYKVGEVPHWLEGLDLLAQAGLSAAVIPHYNNAEGGNHDTRFCYLGERRLAIMEDQLPPGAFVLGVDEHTGLVLDVEAGSAEVVGLGAVTVRAGGRSEQVPTGATVAIAELAQRAESLAKGLGSLPARRSGAGGSGVGAGGSGVGAGGPQLASRGRGPESGRGGSGAGVAAPASPLLASVRGHEATFSEALATRDARGAVRSILELDDELVAWSRDTLESDELDQGRAALRSTVVALGRLAEVGARDPRETVGPFVEAMLELRREARTSRRYDDADRIRDGLIALGVEVRDTPGGTEWDLVP